MTDIIMHTLIPDCVPYGVQCLHVFYPVNLQEQGGITIPCCIHIS